jgi:hypothetical protein
MQLVAETYAASSLLQRFAEPKRSKWQNLAVNYGQKGIDVILI